MARRVFLDVGGHTGETLSVALDRRWGFDRIWTFEPSATCLPALEAMADGRTEVVDAGWWSSVTQMDLHDPGTLHASVESAVSRFGEIERCRFIDAAKWMGDHLTNDDTVWLKINVEAAEIEVLRHLLDTGEIMKVDHLVVHFDVEKVPGMEHHAIAMRSRLDASTVSWREANQVMFGRTTEAKTACWLAWTQGGLANQLRFNLMKLEHLARRRVFRARQWVQPRR